MGSMVCLVTLVLPSATKAQVPVEITQMYQECTDSGGRAASNYQRWLEQNGCICPGSSVGSGQRSCSNASTSTVPAAPLASLTPQQQLGMQVGMLGANMIGQGLHQLLFGTPPPPPDPAEQQRQIAARQLNNSGIYLLRQKNYTGAINEFQKALAITPNDGNIQHNLALAKQKLKDTAVAGQTSGALGQLLDSVPGSAGTLNSAQTQPEGGNGSALNLVNLDSDPNVEDLRGTTKTSVDPAMLKNDPAQPSAQVAGSDDTVQSLDEALGTGPDTDAKRQLDDFANTDLSSGSANPAAQQPNSHLLDGVGNPDFDGSTTGNASIGKGNPSPENAGSGAVDLRGTGTTVVDPARVDGTSPVLQATNPSDEDKALMKNQWETSIDSRYKNDSEVQQNVRDLWTAARAGDSDANEKLAGILSDQFKAAGQTPQQRAEFFANFNAIASGEGPTPKEWSDVSQLANEMDASAGSAALTGAAPEELPPYYSQLLKSIGKAEPITANATYMGTGQQKQDDCVLYAIANGAHVPEKQVNAEFTNIVNHLGMDPIAERTDPGIVVAEPKNGGRGGVGAAEELLVANKFGKVVPVPTDSYARAIASTKQPVITSVQLDKTGAQHKVVVTGVYRTEDGKIYYSVMDSNLGPDYPNSTAYVEKSNFEEHLASGGFVVMPAAN